MKYEAEYESNPYETLEKHKKEINWEVKELIEIELQQENNTLSKKKLLININKTIELIHKNIEKFKELWRR